MYGRGNIKEILDYENRTKNKTGGTKLYRLYR